MPTGPHKRRKPLFQMTPDLLNKLREDDARLMARGFDVEPWRSAIVRRKEATGTHGWYAMQIVRLAKDALDRPKRSPFPIPRGKASAASVVTSFLDMLEVRRVTERLAFIGVPTARLSPMPNNLGQPGRPPEPDEVTVAKVLTVDSLCQLAWLTTLEAVDIWNENFPEYSDHAEPRKRLEDMFRVRRGRVGKYMRTAFPEPKPKPKLPVGRPITRASTIRRKAAALSPEELQARLFGF